MTEQLPVISSFHNVTTTKTKSTSLLGRGLAEILNQKAEVALAEQDKRYRQARDVYNRITDYGSEKRFNDLIPKQSKLLEDQQLLQLQPFFTLMQQLAEVFTVFQQLADQGYGKTYFPLANMYQGGQGITEDIEKAHYYSRLTFDWCFANQALDDSEIWVDLGWMYQFGRGVEQDGGQAEFWHRKAAEQGDVRAQYNLGRMYEDSYRMERDKHAVFWYRKAAEQDCPLAQDCLGMKYLVGRGVEQDDEQAVFWFRKAAEQGYAIAQYNLGIQSDDEVAVFWHRKAAMQGYAPAQSDLANMYDYGIGVQQDGEQAVFWYFMAAEQGDAYAQIKIGHGYDQRLDIENTVFWYRKAAEQDSEWAELAQVQLKKLGFDWKNNNAPRRTRT